MKQFTVLATITIGMLCASCVTTESVRFQTKSNQQSIIRDGQPALISERKNSIVIIRPASRQFRSGERPVFVVGILNRTKAPLEFRMDKIRVTQTVNGESTPLKVITYEMLVQEERTRQAIAALGVGLAAASNSIAASQAGYYSASSTVYTPRGAYLVQTSGYSPTAAAIARANADARNAEMIGAEIERGQANMAMLERTVIKDNTLLPSEWYGGQLHIQPLISDAGIKHYLISIQIGSEFHEISIAQGAS